ncbi:MULTISPECIES: hypothetical protein [unclassified Streptomyces]|uniref:hypothetical protein n=1 Tax=unclassified Streptomyces TaxID=2593676 RepID=UPI0008059C7B|nr:MULTISPECIES: hypothetical protein [unclassified Streptomyces]MYR75113.1 hypothetical protein [Streptomyces sp. SID4925]SBU97961.1 hypothetical protein YUMDRAFT_05983 [Streptomyces sp. OspMP-M45]
MFELRLLDPDGYTVPGTVHTVPDDQASTVRAWLLAEVAVQNADEWNRFGAGYDARDYRVRVTAVNTPVALTAHLDTAA